jgi:hypothetical protein
VFAFKALPWTAGHRHRLATGVDRLDFTALFSGQRLRRTDPIADGYVSLEATAWRTKVFYDADWARKPPAPGRS